MNAAPPRVLRHLLAWVLRPGPVGDGLVGDLDELYADRVRISRVAADLWYARQLLSAAVHYRLRRLWALGLYEQGAMMGGLGRDFGHGLRMLRRTPGFTAVIVLTLALGIGANTAVFSVVRSVLLRPLPFPEDERLAVLLMRDTLFQTLDVNGFSPSPPEYVAYRDNARSWDGELAYYLTQPGTVTGDGGEPQRMEVGFATWNLFATLRTEPLLGRTFTADEDRQGSDRVAVLSHGFWTSRYGGDPQVVGTTLQLDGVPRTIVGVMPPELRSLRADVRLWVPLALTPQAMEYTGFHRCCAVGRLRPGATLASAERELNELVARLSEDPAVFKHASHRPFLRSLRSGMVGDVIRTLWLMLGAVALVLLIACTNVANLLLVRAEGRASEMSLRTALGAGRGRLLSQLLTEGLVLAAVGGAAGVAVAYAGVEVLRALAPADLPRLDEIRVDGAVLAFTMTLTLTAGLVFGVVPSLHASRAHPQGVLHEGRTGAGRGRIRVRQLLVVSETAFAVVLLVAAGLLLRSFRQLMAVDPGFSVERVLTATTAIPAVAYPDAEDVVGFYGSLLSRIASLPGVTAAGAVTVAPLTRPGGEGIEIGAAGADVQVVTPSYFAAMGIELSQGRVLDDRDGLDAPLVAVVSEALGRRYPLGSRIGTDNSERTAEIVGVVSDVIQRRLDRPDPFGTMYLAHAQAPLILGTFRSMTLTVRTAIEPTSLVGTIRREVEALDPTVPLYDVRTLEQVVADTTATRRFSMVLQFLFAVVALSLAAVGLYGVLAYTVARRAGEIGVRMALGANRADVQRLVVRQGMGIVAVALMVGLGVALATGRLIGSLLFGVSPGDPATYATVTGVLLAVALFACWIPARRASRMDPAVALRGE